MDIKDKKNINTTKTALADPMRYGAEVFGGGRPGSPLLLSRGKVSNAFYTEDSKLYITPKEYELLRKGVKLDRSVRKWDCLSSRIARDYKRYNPNHAGVLYRALKKRSEALALDIEETSHNLFAQFSMVRLWNLSIVGAILLGMFSMTMIYRYLGQGAAAEEVARANVQTSQTVSTEDASFTEMEKTLEQSLYGLNEIDDQKKLELEIRGMVKGYPIEDMVSYIAQKDRKVAAYLVAIAKKESDWGKHVPILKGQNCNNLWGYRGQRELMGTGGHTCFNSRKDAVDTVAKRIETLINQENLATPAEMVVWKCGRDCNATGGQAAANKWISDVNRIYAQLKD